MKAVPSSIWGFPLFSEDVRTLPRSEEVEIGKKKKEKISREKDTSYPRGSTFQGDGKRGGRGYHSKKEEVGFFGKKGEFIELRGFWGSLSTIAKERRGGACLRVVTNKDLAIL